ncbi:MAG: amidohydrolase family protein [Verrucomicrobiae bacterium]|nr:amidohydrolase family protein [Verrucomicrobiae bacterium]
MRINCHAHVFTFRSLFTEATLAVLLRRISRERWPEFVVEAVSKLLKKLIKGDYLSEDELLRELVGAFRVSSRFKKYLGSLNRAVPADISLVVQGDIDGLAAGALRDILRRIGDLVTENEDAENRTLNDLIAFLALGIQPGVERVARRLMDLSGDGTGVVALTLDITNGDKADAEVFRRQVRDTSRAALAYPGRFFPFIAVNTLRKDHYAIMETALTSQGYVGVKLYPSLGYPVGDSRMRRVFEYCEAHAVPMLMHCNKGGFYGTEASIQQCDPGHWPGILKDHPGLKICFAHFGGEENLLGEGIPTGSWTDVILTLMGDYEGVYADMAFHLSPMKGGELESRYFRNLEGLMREDPYRDRILFGSDFFLSRVRVREDNHWRYFESKFRDADFDRMTRANPVRYLGLPGGSGGAVAPNIARYVDFIAAHSREVGELPAPWLEKAVRSRHGDVRFTVNPWGLQWSINNDAHYYAWQYFRTMMRAEDAGLSFNQAGRLIVRQLKGWPTEQVDRTIRAGRLREHAASMHLSLVNAHNGPGAKPEPGVTRKRAESVLAGLLGNGETLLAEFGEVVDGLYRFKREERT